MSKHLAIKLVRDNSDGTQDKTTILMKRSLFHWKVSGVHAPRLHWTERRAWADFQDRLFDLRRAYNIDLSELDITKPVE